MKNPAFYDGFLIRHKKQMPCSCKLPLEIYPESAEWGPLLWTILHGIAERSGAAVTPLFRSDERRQLTSLFHAVAKMIPCPSCKEHYTEYLKEHPVDKTLKDIPYEEIRPYVRRWFWELHNWVNESYGKPIFSLEDVATTYRSVAIRTVMKQLAAPMQRAIRLQSGQLFGYNEFVKAVTMLLSLYGL